MRTIFNKRNCTYFRWKLLLYTIMSLIIIISDIQCNIFFKIQNYINYSSLFLHSLTNISNQWLKVISQSLNNNKQLLLENSILQQEIFIKNSELLLTKYYKQENIELKKLLYSPLFHNEKKMLTQVISNEINTYTSRMIIDKGINNGVYIGQPVVNDQGIVGQVISTNKLTSQILLICDISHALPVQILRNNIRMILQGNGYNKNLQVKHCLNDTDIKINDILITSGLGGRFPIGYPVAIISSITKNNKTGYTKIQASPIADLNCLLYLLLLWNIEEHITNPFSPNEVQTISKKRLNLSDYKKYKQLPINSHTNLNN